MVVQGESAEHITSCTTKALARVGLPRVVVVNVPNGSMLVPASQVCLLMCDPTDIPLNRSIFTISKKLLKTPGICGVLALHVAAPYQHMQASNQEGALLHLGNLSDKPIIPGVVCQASKLEANGVIPNLAEEWATAMAGLLAVHDYSEVKIIDPVEVST